MKKLFLTVLLTCQVFCYVPREDLADCQIIEYKIQKEFGDEFINIDESTILNGAVIEYQVIEYGR